MHLVLPTAGLVSTPTVTAPTTPFAVAPANTPEPPKRWSRYWTTPIAKVEYGPGSRIPFWGEATIPADRGLTGALRPSVTYGGTTREAAIEAARLLAGQPVDVTFSFKNGRTRTAPVNPAIAVLRDTRAGAYWLAPLRTTVRNGDEWIDAPHTIDGHAFEGADALLTPPTILSATRDMVAIVGRDTVITPQAWADAPDGSLDRS